MRPAGQVANALSFTVAPLIIKAGTTGAVTVRVTDQYGNAVAQSADLIVTLKADSLTGKFYDKAEGGTEINSVAIKQGESEATVYYYDTTAGDQKITVSAEGLDPADGTIKVVAAEPDKIAIEADGAVVVNEKVKLTFTVLDQFGNPVIVDGSPLTLVLSSSSSTGRFEDESGKQITQVTVTEGESSAVACYKDSQPGEVTITARTTGLQGSGTLVVQAGAGPDITPPGDVTGLTVEYAPGAGCFKLSYTRPEDADFAGVEVFVAPLGSQNWQAVEPDVNNVVQVPEELKGLVLGKDRVQFKVVAVDASKNKSQGIVTDNDGQGYPVVACYELTPGPDGWRTFSVPVQLAGGKTLLGDVINTEAVEIAYKFDAPSQQWVQITEENNSIQPLEAVYVKVKAPVLAVVMPTTVQANPPVKELAAGWNLVGFTKDNDSVDNALYSVRGKWSVTVSPAVNPNPWSVTPNSVNQGTIKLYNGCWVYMDAVGSLAGFSTTPVTVGAYGR